MVLGYWKRPVTATHHSGNPPAPDRGIKRCAPISPATGFAAFVIQGQFADLDRKSTGTAGIVA